MHDYDEPAERRCPHRRSNGLLCDVQLRREEREICDGCTIEERARALGPTMEARLSAIAALERLHGEDEHAEDRADLIEGAALLCFALERNLSAAKASLRFYLESSNQTDDERAATRAMHDALCHLSQITQRDPVEKDA
jgi:hypothetical protein